MVRTLVLLILAILADHANGQLIARDRNLNPNSKPIEIASDVPQKLRGDASLTFRNLDIFFDGGSHGAEFRRHDGGKLILFFPHHGYWTPAARHTRTQPVAVLIRRNGKQMLVEIKRDSKLNQRIVELVIADIASGRHSSEKLSTLNRIRESVRNRTPLKEIAERMDRKDR